MSSLINPLNKEPKLIRQSMWVFLKPYLLPFRGLILAALFLNAFHGIAIAFQNLVPRYLIDDVLMAKGLTTDQRYANLWKLSLAYLGATLICRMLVWHIGYRIFTYVREKVMFALRADFFRHVNGLCLRFHLKHHSGELFSYLFGSPLQQLQTYLQQFTFSVPGAVVQLVATLVWIGAWDHTLTGILLLLVISNVLLMNRARGRIQRLQDEFQSTESNVSGYVADLLRGSRDVKLYGMEQKVSSDFQERVWQIGKKAYRRDVQGHVENMKQETVSYFCFALLCAACTWRYLQDQSTLPEDHRVTIGQIQGYLTCFISLQGPLSQLFIISTQRGAAQAGLDRIAAMLQTASTTPDPVGPLVSIPSKGAIKFSDVTFSYDGHRPVFDHLNITIPYGQKVALVGPSGAGKSTFAQFVLRFYDPDSGTVSIGGMDLRRCQGQDLRRSFSVVPQDPFIFRTTIRQNLSVAKPDATDAELRQACELAHAWEFIARLPNGFETPVGEGGATLSGGQKQRLAIARALLTHQEFFIFDEATSALDTVSEGYIQKALEEAMREKTALVIAHRLATVKSCDRLLVFKEGRIQQDGTYEQLIATPGIFQDLLHGQLLRT